MTPPAPLSSSPSPAARRAVRGLVAAFGISSVGFGAMAPFLVLWGHDTAGLAGSAAGLLFVAQAAGEIAGGLGGGLLADRLGGRQVLLVSTLGMTLGYGALALVHSAPLAIAIIFAAGLFEAAFHPTALALVGDLTPSGDRTRTYGIMRAAANLGTILGPLAGALVVAQASTPDVFLVTAALLAAAGATIVATLPNRAAHVDLHEEAEELQAAVPGLKAIAHDRRLGLLVAGGGLLAITIGWWEADGLAILRDQRAFSTTDFSIMLAISAAVTVVFQLPVTKATRNHPVGALLAIGATLQAIGLALLATAASGLALVGAAVVLVAFGQMLYGPNLNALVSEIAPPGRGATYQAAISTTADIGMAGGPASGLALSAGSGARAMWLLALPLGLVAAAAAGRAAYSPDERGGGQEDRRAHRGAGRLAR
jgi:MFS family permease